MKWYIDITLLPDAEASLGFLWKKMYPIIHVALVESKSPEGNFNLAVSFPGYGDKSFPLGAKLRLFATTRERLQQLDISGRLNRFSDYCHWTSIKEVPEVKKYVCFSRKQFKTSVIRLARRRMKRTNESLEGAIDSIKSKGFTNMSSNLPYINLQSSSTQENSNAKHIFRLFIEKTDSNSPAPGSFNSYGLSKSATVPWF